jgi:hypothetical protein
MDSTFSTTRTSDYIDKTPGACLFGCLSFFSDSSSNISFIQERDTNTRQLSSIYIAPYMTENYLVAENYLVTSNYVSDNLAVPPPNFQSPIHLDNLYVRRIANNTNTITQNTHEAIEQLECQYESESTSVSGYHLPNQYCETDGKLVPEMVSQVETDKHCRHMIECPICTESRDGFLLSCCQNKQFICFHCFMEMILRKYGKTGKMTADYVQRNSITIFEEYHISCPFCFQKTKLQMCDKNYGTVLEILLELVNQKCKKRCESAGPDS